MSDANFNQLHIPPKMFVDLNFTIINLTNTHKIKRIKTQHNHYTQTSSLNEKLDTISHIWVFYWLMKWFKQTTKCTQICYMYTNMYENTIFQDV